MVSLRPPPHYDFCWLEVGVWALQHPCQMFLPVVLSVPPQVQPGPGVLKVLAGEAVDLNCAAEGSPKPRLHWAKDGVALRGGRPEGSIHFAAIQTSDAGMYRCEASSSAGVDAWELELRVLGESPLNPRACLSPSSQQQPGLLRSLTLEAMGLWSATWALCPLGWTERHEK